MTEYSFSPGLKERDPALFQRYKEIKLANDAALRSREYGARSCNRRRRT